MLETEWRHVIEGKAIIRLPKSSTRKCHITYVQVLERVDMNRRVYGESAWIGKRYRAGTLLDEAALYAGREHDPIVLEITEATPLEPGSRTPRGRWRELAVLWQWNPKRAEWRELGRCLGMPLDAAPELRQYARRALRQELWRDTETAEAAADRIHHTLRGEYCQLGEQRPVVVAILHALLCTEMAYDEDEVRRLRPRTVPATSPPCRRSSVRKKREATQ